MIIEIISTLSYKSLMHKSRSDLARLVLDYADQAAKQLALRQELQKKIDLVMQHDSNPIDHLERMQVPKEYSNINKCPACGDMFKDGGTCKRGGCPMGGDF